MKVLKDDNYREKINSYTKQDWKPLFDLIPLIEQTDKFGDDTEAMKSLEKGSATCSSRISSTLMVTTEDFTASMAVTMAFLRD